MHHAADLGDAVLLHLRRQRRCDARTLFGGVDFGQRMFALHGLQRLVGFVQKRIRTVRGECRFLRNVLVDFGIDTTERFAPKRAVRFGGFQRIFQRVALLRGQMALDSMFVDAVPRIFRPARVRVGIPGCLGFLSAAEERQMVVALIGAERFAQLDIGDRTQRDTAALRPAAIVDAFFGRAMRVEMVLIARRLGAEFEQDLSMLLPEVDAEFARQRCLVAEHDLALGFRVAAGQRHIFFLRHRVGVPAQRRDR